MLSRKVLEVMPKVRAAEKTRRSMSNSSRHYERWSPREVVTLRSYAERGLSTREAAVLMKRSWSAVWNIAQRLSISFHGPAGAPKMNRNRKTGAWRKSLREAAQ